MGIDLTLVPVQWNLPGPILAHTRLDLQCRDYDLHSALRKVATPLTVPLNWYDDDGLTEYLDDRYGTKLTFVTAHQFCEAVKGLRDYGSDWDRAVIAFVAALAPDRRIVLWFN